MQNFGIAFKNTTKMINYGFITNFFKFNWQLYCIVNEIQKIESLLVEDFKSNLDTLIIEDILDNFFIIGELTKRMSCLTNTLKK